jgi:phosphatidylinositol alpha-mannosyltransferase
VTTPPLRIALIAEDYYPQRGGVPEHVHHLARELSRRGHRATIVTSHMRNAGPDPAYVRRVGTSVVIYANGGVSRVTAGWRLTERLAQLFRTEQFDLIHVHGGLAPTFGMLAPRAARRAGLPVIATFHSWFDGSLGFRLLRRPLQRLLDQHAATIAVSPAAVAAHARYVTADWQIIPNGVDTEYFSAEGRRPATAPPPGPTLLYLHRLEPRNHLTTLLRAMPAILARLPEARLIVAGDGPWRRLYERMARPLGSSVEFLGRIEDRAERYRAADLYLCPTMRGSFGITLLEAMACGAPMVLADNPGFRSVIGDSDVAVMLPHEDHAAWAETVIALSLDSARRQAMTAAGLARVQRFAWPQVTDEVLDVYQRVLRKAPATHQVRTAMV